MREKCEMLKQRVERLKNQKGFTLVELMAVLVILGLILAIAIPMVGSMVNKTERKADDASFNLIVKSAEYAYLDGYKSTPESGDLTPPKDVTYTVKELVDEGYLDVKLHGAEGSEKLKYKGEELEATAASVTRDADTGKFKASGALDIEPTP